VILAIANSSAFNTRLPSSPVNNPSRSPRADRSTASIIVSMVESRV